jgi:hypothetical protein
MTTTPPSDAAGDAERRETARRLAERKLAQRATRILSAHVRDADGWCAGCLGDFGTMRLHPCYLATWATEITAVPDTPY